MLSLKEILLEKTIIDLWSNKYAGHNSVWDYEAYVERGVTSALNKLINHIGNQQITLNIPLYRGITVSKLPKSQLINYVSRTQKYQHWTPSKKVATTFANWADNTRIGIVMKYIPKPKEIVLYFPFIKGYNDTRFGFEREAILKNIPRKVMITDVVLQYTTDPDLYSDRIIPYQEFIKRT